MITKSSAVASARASVKLRQQEKKEAEPRRSGRKTKPSYTERIAELTAQFIKEEKQRVLALKEVRALKPKEKAPKRKPDNLKFSSVQKRVKVDEKNVFLS